MVNYAKYLKALLKDIRLYKSTNAPKDKIVDIFKDWYFGYCSMQRFDAIQLDEYKEMIDEIYVEVFGHSKTEIIDIAKRISHDYAKEQALNHNNFEKTVTEEEREIYFEFARVVH